MEKMISVINDNLTSVVSGIKEHLTDVENRLNQINQQIQTRLDIASKYKNDILDAKNTINDLESNIQSLNVQLADLNARYGNDFKEIAAAATREFNNKIKNDNAIITTNANKILETTKLVNDLKAELEELNKQKSFLESDYSKTIILSNYYENRINEIIDFSVNHPEQLESYVGTVGVPGEELKSTETLEIHDEKDIVNDDIFSEIDRITSTEPDKSLVNEVMENVGNPDYESSYTKTIPTPEEDLSLTKQLDDVISEAQALIIKSQEKENEDIKQEPIDYSLDEKFEPIVNNIDVINEPILTEEDLLTSSLSTLGFDVGSFRREDLDRITPNYDEVKASKVVDVLKKYNIDISYVSSCPEILLMDDNDLDYILEILTKNGLNIHNVVYYINVLPYINRKQLMNTAKYSSGKELTELIYKCVGDDGNIYIDRYISMGEKDIERLKKNATVDDFRIINMFPEIVVENFNTLVNLKVTKASECLLDHPHRFIFNPDKFADILDKYELDDLIRCIDKNPAVIDKL